MVKMRQAAIPEVGFARPGGTAMGIEVTTLESLWRRAAPGRHLVRPQRPEFHLVFVVTAGAGHHTVDFAEHPLGPGSVMWVRPGQVQQFDPAFQLRGPLLMFRPDFPPPGTAVDDPFGAVTWTLSPAQRRLVQAGLRHLAVEYAALPDQWNVAHSAVLAHLLGAVLHRLVLADKGTQAASQRPVPASREVFTRFRAAVERDFAEVRHVEHYARTLGYSTRTVARATTAVAGMSPKAFIDHRVVLEARRLLAHTDLPAARIADRLGFPDPTNFLKFFQHRTGTTPGRFRRQLAADAG